MVQVSDLLWVTVSVPPTQIEEVLSRVERLPEPVNCDIRYENGQMEVGFPTYQRWLSSLRALFPGVISHTRALPSCK